ITSGSTAMTFLFGLAFRSTPVAVTPEHPSQSPVYAVAVAVMVLPSGLSWEDSCDCFSFVLFSEDTAVACADSSDCSADSLDELSFDELDSVASDAEAD